MFIYLFGLFVALLLCFWNIVNSYAAATPQVKSNLEKVGKRLNRLTLEPIDILYGERLPSKASDSFDFLLWWAVAPLLLTITSWVYVVITLPKIVYKMINDFTAPKEVKELRWRLRNTDLEFDETIKLFMKAEGQDLAEFNQIREQLIKEIENLRANI